MSAGQHFSLSASRPAARAGLAGYRRLDGTFPLQFAPGAEDRAGKLKGILEAGSGALSEVLGEDEPSALRALLVAEEDWEDAPRESGKPYPRGLPYFTRVMDPPALVLPEKLSPAIQPRTEATWPLTVWHELAHAFLLRQETVRTPAWLGELIPQSLAAAVSDRNGLSLRDHLARVEREPGFTIRGLRGHADAGTQMAFQNLLLLLGAAALDEFGEAFLRRLVAALREQTEAVDEERSERLLANALGSEGRDWLRTRPEF